jgi:hypothetical protein
LFVLFFEELQIAHAPLREGQAAVPFSVWVTRAANQADAYREAVRLLKPDATLPSKAPGLELDRRVLEDALRPLHPKPHAADRATWLSYAKTREPWCSVFTTPAEGPLWHVELSASFSNPEFMRNTLDMFELGLSLAKRLGARLFDEHTEITSANIDSYLDLKGPLVNGLHSFWKAGQRPLLDGMEAPLEFPLGAIDQVGEFLVFKLRTKKAPPPLDELVAGLPSHLSAHVLQGSAILENIKAKAPVVRVIRADDGVLVRPFWSHLRFGRLASETFDAVDRLEERLGVPVEYEGKQCDRRARLALQLHATGLGVDYYEWRRSEMARSLDGS